MIEIPIWAFIALCVGSGFTALFLLFLLLDFIMVIHENKKLERK